MGNADRDGTPEIRHVRLVSFKNAVHNGNVLSGNFVYGDVTDNVGRIRRICEEEKIATVECGFHGSTGTA